jgi:glycosyltransferase involved in cell wall biosynthesis
MRIAILVPLFPPKWLAGTEIATYNTARHLVKRGHEVHVITSLDRELPKEGVEQGFYVHRVGFPRLRFLGTALFWLKALLRLKRLKPDIVHGQSIAMGVVGFLAKKLLKKPYVVYGRGTEVYLPWLFKKLISRLVLKNAEAAMALTQDMKREMQKSWNRDIWVIPNGIDLERFDNLPRDEMRVKLRAKAGERLILFVGRFRPEKGVKYLVEAMAIVRQNYRSARLLLVGEGPEEDSLRQLARQLDSGDYLEFVGQIQNEEVPQYMAAADIFVLPSLAEGFPVTVLEAMASGLPIVATRAGGLPEIIEDGHNGFLVEPKNLEQIADRLLQLLGNDELRARFSANNRGKAKGYGWERVTASLQEVYQKCLGNPQPPSS